MASLLQLTTIALLSLQVSAMRPESLKFSPVNTTEELVMYLQGNYKGILTSLSEKFHSLNSDVFQDISYTCLNDTEKVIQDLKQHYAQQFVDADAKVPYGILQGQIFWTGDYHECINIESLYNTFTGHTFKGRYFTAKIGKLYVGVCIPDSCDKHDAKSLVSSVFNPEEVTGIYTSDRIKMDEGDTAGLVICCIIAAIVVIASTADYFTNNSIVTPKQHENGVVNGYIHTEHQQTERTGLLAEANLLEDKPAGPSKLVKILRTFSFFRNTKRLMSTQTATGPLACLNGLRVISMFWVIQGHTYGFATIVLKDPLFAQKQLGELFSFQAILNGTYSVDSFFFLSGLLVAFLALKEFSDKGRINWVYYFAHRYWRLTPIYAITLMFFTTVFRSMITGPFWPLALDPAGPLYAATHDCRTYWWSNLLYINNLYPHYGSASGCMGWSWYLANDMQFYVLLSPLVIILLHKNKKIGLAFCGFLIAGCIASRAIVANYYGMNQLGQVTKHGNEDWAKGGPLYTKPYARWSVYIVGMVTGYILQKTRCNLRINKVFVVIGWAIAIAMGLSVIYGLYYYNSHPGSVMPKPGTILYLSCARTAWSLALAWLVIACATGHGGWVKNILSYKLWAPLGRLTYAAYLVHLMIIFGFYLNAVAPLQFTQLLFVYLFIGNVVLSYGTAYIVSMAVEAPMMQLEKLILNKS